MHEPSKELKQHERFAMSKILNIPHRSIPASSIVHLDEFGWKAMPKTMELRSIAARCRAYVSSNIVHNMVDLIEQHKKSIDAFAIPPQAAWHSQAMVTNIAEAH